MKNISIIAFVLIAACFLPAAGMAKGVTNDNTILVAHHYYPPYYNKRGEGLAAELFRAAFGKSGISVEFRSVPIGRPLSLLLNKEVDAISPGRLSIPDALKESTISVDVFNVLLTWVYFEPNFTTREPPSLGSLLDFKVGLLNQSPWHELHKAQGLNLFGITYPEQGIKMLRNSRIDVYESTVLSGLFLTGNLFAKDAHKFKYITREPAAVGLSFLNSTARQRSLAQAFTQGLNRIISSGKYMQIVEGYWGKGNVPNEALPDAVKTHGSAAFDADRFLSETRDFNGKILK